MSACTILIYQSRGMYITLPFWPINRAACISLYHSDLSIARHVYHSTILIYQSRGMYITLLF